ncbi:PQQ-dependent sugar dehydrogenase [Marinilongibacter aquaticus]|uniref:PQQ-dependent sugar dehydrogenase n=1 Tax=Marinilongibacter aquaticus TaxID=2975157 RepID=UPI0021BDA266|nr:PQQ-dependent sugar dehydrogenase [Marinilongibacter aquaticus]UBM59035.1 PQQ-dependent sugar dehydrogenase [Marinilongibacter aquaticus]
MRKILLFSGLVLAAFSCTTKQSSSEKPENNRFTEVELARGLDEPMEMTFLPGHKVLIVERKGGMKLVDEESRSVSDAGFVPVNIIYTNKEGKTRAAEEGLMGVVADPNFEQNNWIYMYYADPDTPKHVLARWEFKDDYLVDDSKKILLEVPTQREECCHTGGGMTWDPQGNLYLTVGNNTVNPRSGASNLNEAPGHKNEDDQRTDGNSNDLRGKILRIHPEADGSYTIPEGNLFPVGMEKTRPEIYTMGHRNPWRPSIDTQTGYLYWGEVGPDASKDSIWGPKGYDEFNQAKKAGFFGWPYFIANSRPYNHYNSEDGTYGEPFDVNHPVNESVNNTGLRELPTPVVPAFIYYPYGPSEEFPLVGTAGRSATGGPVFREADFKNAERPWPAYFEGKWLITEFMRGWIMSITMDENGDYKSMERILPDKNFSGAIDMDFGPSGDLYVLEYGTAWFKGNANSRLVRLEYNAGNRKPIVEAQASVWSGELPLQVDFSSEGTMDYDGDKLKYTWEVKQDGQSKAKLDGEKVSYTFEEQGEYEVLLTVDDGEGANNTKSLMITAGNKAPEVSLEVEKANKSFYFGEKNLKYTVKVNDLEDGQTPDQIKPYEVAVTFDYVPEGYDPVAMAANQALEEQTASFNIGRKLIEGGDCISCHQFDSKSIGPSYKAVAERYPASAANREKLVSKIIEGGSGVWGEHGMSAHPDLSRIDASRMVDYIFSMKNAKGTNGLGLEGVLNPKVPDYETDGGSFVLRAAYHDKGNGKAKSLFGEQLLVLRTPYLMPHQADFKSHTEVLTASQNAFYAVGDGASIGYKQIDLSGLAEIVVYVQINERSGAKGAKAVLHLDSPEGEVLATSDFQGETPSVRYGPPPKGLTVAEWRRQNAGKLSLNLPEGLSGTHDIYIEFKNENAESNAYLCRILELGFGEKK